MKEEKEKEDLTVNGQGNGTQGNSHKASTLGLLGVNMSALKGLSASGVNMSALKGLSASGVDMSALKGLSASGVDMSALKGLSALGVNLSALKGLSASGVNLSALKGLSASGVDMSALKGLSALGVNLSALKGLSASGVSQISSKWVLSNSVVSAMALVNKEKESKYIFSKIPQGEYQLSHSFDEESEKLEHILERSDTKEAIPIKGIPSAIALTDVITSLNINEVGEFYNHLVEFPLLGLEHSVGRKILDEIGNVDLTSVENLNLFRVRQRNPRTAPFTYKEMFEAPHGFASHGRYNPLGHGELYTCENKKVALDEVASIDQDLRYDIIEWKLEKPLNVLDLANSDSPLVQYCSFEKTSKNGQEYLLPNFLAQCAKYNGISGIRYKSVANPDVLNYVFFDFEKKWFNRVELETGVQIADVAVF